jgi:RNA-directed DNA polymerase
MQNNDKPALVPTVDKQAGEGLWYHCKAQYGVWSKNMLIALQRGVKGNKWFSLMDKVYAERTLGIAWEKVQDNAGACGIDRMSIEHFAKDTQSRLLVLNKRLSEGSYKPMPVRRVYIPKAGSKQKRPLGIPCVKDRVVQTALKMVLEPIFEQEFSEHSYGFRPGRSCKDALREVEKHLKSGYTHVVDIDIQGYFDHIPHQPLMRRVKEHIADGKVLELVEGFLKQGIMSEGIEYKAEEGSPQGGVISPLLANIYLNPLDWLMSQQDVKIVRYADDIVILCKSEQASQNAHQQVNDWMNEAGLTLHPEKTHRVDMSEPGKSFEFLGYRFKRSSKGRLIRLVRDKSRNKLRDNVRRVTRRNNAHSMERIIDEKLNPILRGWFGYFKHVHISELKELDHWIRMRLRSILRKRNGGKGRGRGIDHLKWKNCYFKQLGLCFLADSQAEYISLQKGAPH